MLDIHNYIARKLNINIFLKFRYFIFIRLQNLLLNLILQFNCTDLYNQVPKLIDSKMLQSVFTKESEEINKVFILCIARSFIVTGLLTKNRLKK
jgi:hypothetical protein